MNDRRKKGLRFNCHKQFIVCCKKQCTITEKLDDKEEEEEQPVAGSVEQPQVLVYAINESMGIKTTSVSRSASMVT